VEKNNITLDPSSSFGTSSSADINVPPEGMVQRSSRIKRIQTTAMILLFFAAVINYLDRSSLSVANLTIREELGLSATQIGVLLSVFSLAYGIAQLPCGPLLDRKGPRIMLGLGMCFWSLFQAMSGMVHSFTQFVLVRIGMGIGEAPMNPCGVKVINDWFNIKDRGMPMGMFNAASMIGLSIAPPILAAMMLVLGWRGYRRMGDFTPFDLDRPAHWNRRLLRWLASFAPQRPLPSHPADPAADPGLRP